MKGRKTRLARLSDIHLLACLIEGEARGEPVHGKIAVGCAVRNRANNPCWWGRTWKEVMLKPKQFSCFDDHNLVAMEFAWKHRKTNLRFQESLFIAKGIVSGKLLDFVNGANHYHARSLKKYPAWAKDQVALRVGNHLFYKL